MNAVSRVLVVGGGIVGNSVTVLLRKHGIDVDLVEKDPRWAVSGSGIALLNNAQRVLREVGVLDEVLEQGASVPQIHGVSPVTGHEASSSSPARATPFLECGIYRPTLQKILIAAVHASGASVRLGETVKTLDQTESLEENGAGGFVDVAFTDGTTGRYDLVLGADGVRSSIRSMIGINLDSTPMDLGIWRVYTRRPATVQGFQLFRSGPCHVAGIHPANLDHVYAFVVVDARPKAPVPEEKVAIMRELASGYAEEWPVWREIQESIASPDQVDYRRFEYLLLDKPWHRGRVVVIGDAAHAHPPTLAQGAALGLEDALVLTELLTTHDRLTQELLNSFTERRFHRVRMIAETSVRLAEMNKEGAPNEVWTEIWARTMRLIAAPA